uniref:DUF1737 domain-containing protein n=1 Tax=viral metagenome TaxID=1070528 RepID=A0A6H1ZAU7_9ZZZZ
MNKTFDVIRETSRSEFVEAINAAKADGWTVRGVQVVEVEIDRNHNKDVIYYAWVERDDSFMPVRVLTEAEKAWHAYAKESLTA